MTDPANAEFLVLAVLLVAVAVLGTIVACLIHRANQRFRDALTYALTSAIDRAEKDRDR